MEINKRQSKDQRELIIKAAEQNALVDVYSVEKLSDSQGDYYYLIVSSDSDGLDIKEFNGLAVKHREGTMQEDIKYQESLHTAFALNNASRGLL